MARWELGGQGPSAHRRGHRGRIDLYSILTLGRLRGEPVTAGTGAQIMAGVFSICASLYGSVIKVGTGLEPVPVFIAV